MQTSIRFTWPILCAGALAVVGCGGGGVEPTGSGGGSSSSSTSGSGGGETLPNAGIPDCNAMFQQDGVCRPRLESCPAGTIPDFATGCAPVGISGCAKEFSGQDGLCHVVSSACPAGSIAVPTEGCVPIDGPDGCGAAPWGAIADMPGTVWVDPAYGGADRDGSKDKPLMTVAEALAIVKANGRIALAAGTYAEPIELNTPLEIVGRCPSLVKITGTAPVSGKPTVVHVNATGKIALRRLQISGDGIGVRLSSGDVALENTWIYAAQNVGLVLENATTQGSMTHSLIQGTRALDDGTGGQGIVMVSGAGLSMDRSAVVDNRVVGVYVSGKAAKISMVETLVEGTGPQASDGGYGTGLFAGAGAIVDVDRSAFVSNRETAFDVRQPGTIAKLTHSIIENTQPTQASNHYGGGAWADSGAALTIDQTVLSANHGSGLGVHGKEATATVTASLIRATQPSADDKTLGYGIGVDAGAKLVLTGSTVVDNHFHAVAVTGDATVAEIKGSLLQGTKTQASDGSQGEGALILDGATATIDRSALVDNHTAGLWTAKSSSVTLNDSLIEKNLPDDAGHNGLGLLAYGVPAFNVTRTAILSHGVAGVLVAGSSGSIQESLVIAVSEAPFVPWSAIKALAATSGMGDGIVILDKPGAATFDVTGTFVEGAARAGVLFAGGGGLNGAWVRENRFGVAVQAGSAPAIGEDNRVEANSESDWLKDATLAVP